MVAILSGGAWARVKLILDKSKEMWVTVVILKAALVCYISDLKSRLTELQ